MNKDGDKARLEMSHEIFGDRLQYFVRRWRPQHPQDLYDFQMDLTRLMCDAMRHQSETLSYGLEYYASQRFAEMAIAPLNMIFKTSDKP